MRSLFEDEAVEAVFLVDASNAIKSPHREAALQNTYIISPILAPMLTNTYQSPARLYIGGEHILSQEGTTQENPLAMVMYLFGTLPLIHKLQGNVTQAWYADNALTGGELSGLWMHRWMCTVPGTGKLFQPLKEVIQHQFLPALTGREAFSDTKRALLALPARHGGLGIPI